MEKLSYYFDIVNENREFLLIYVAVLGAFVGSFINVVVARLPIMMHRSHVEEIEEYAESVGGTVSFPEHNGLPATLNGRSECPHCHARIPFYLNIPILGFFMARMRCVACKEPISWRYPLVELFTALLSTSLIYVMGLSFTSVMALVITWILISAILIDLDELLLPDELNFSVLWLGLLAGAMGLEGTLELKDSVIGAIVGYGSLWSLYWLFKVVTGKEGMGYGDFKLFAAMGVLIGASAIPYALLLAVVATALLTPFAHRKIKDGSGVPFGPGLAIGGWCMWMNQIGVYTLPSWIAL